MSAPATAKASMGTLQKHSCGTLRQLDFVLPRFHRVSWVSPDIKGAWEPKLDAARIEQREVILSAVLSGRRAPRLFATGACDVPPILNQMLATTFDLVVLGPCRSPGFAALLCLTPESAEIWCSLVPSAEREVLEQAWRHDDVSTFSALNRIPPCCAAAASAKPDRLETEWRLMSAQPNAAARLNYRLYHLGVAPLPYFACEASCTASLTLAGEGAAPISRSFLDLPTRWSALHGIAEVVTPIVRSAFECIATADLHESLIGDLSSAPAEAPTGVRFPFLPPKGKKVEATVSFKRGIAHIADRAETLELGAVDRLLLSSSTPLPECPVFLTLPGSPWPAFDRWTPAFLKDRLGDAPVAELLVPGGKDTPETFAAFLDELLSVEGRTNEYLFGFRFEDLAPEMLDDYSVPDALFSWHYLLRPEEQPTYRVLILGGRDTGTHLHQEALNTDTFVAVIWGRKRWALCPPGSDSRLLNASVNLFDSGISSRLSRQGLAISHCVQNAGDILYVPNGWWHQVENLAPTLALSENIVCARNADRVLAGLANPGHAIDPDLASALRRCIDLGKGARLPISPPWHR